MSSGSASSTCSSKDRRGRSSVAAGGWIHHPRRSTHSGGDYLLPSSSKGRDPFGESVLVQGRTSARGTKENGTKHHVQERKKGERRGSRNGATKATVPRRSERPRLARVLTTSHGDEDAHHTSTRPSWTFEWRLSASAYCHTRCLVHISMLKCGSHAISFYFFFPFVHTLNIAR